MYFVGFCTFAVIGVVTAKTPHAGASKILGLEVAGIIHEVSKGVTKYKKGDRVMALLDGGGYAQYAVAPEGYVMPLPKNLSFAEGAGIPEVCLLLLLYNV